MIRWTGLAPWEFEFPFLKARLEPRHPTPYTYTLHPTPSTLNPRPSTLDPQPSTLNPQPSTLNPQPSTLNPQPLSVGAGQRKVMFACFKRKLTKEIKVAQLAGYFAISRPPPVLDHIPRA